MMESMGFLGPQGTHSEAAALYLQSLLPAPVQLIAFPEIYMAMQAVEEGQVDTCLVPVENSLEGSINITLDTLAHSDTLAVERELIWGVHNQLMARCQASAIRRIYSHAQPLAQCREYLKKHYPKAELVTVASTAKAAKLVALRDASEGQAAICTKRAGELYGLDTIAVEIQDNMANCTRFYEVRRKADVKPRSGSPEKTLVICQIDGSKAGSLCEVLQEFAQREVNMTRIESRPARTELGAYIFFFDLETGASRENLEASIEAVRRKSIWLRELGEFPVLRAVNC